MTDMMNWCYFEKEKGLKSHGWRELFDAQAIELAQWLTQSSRDKSTHIHRGVLLSSSWWHCKEHALFCFKWGGTMH